MAQGKAKMIAPAQSGGLVSPAGAEWAYIYEASTVKNPNFDIGDRVVLPDGREFRYSKSSGACTTVVGCHFTSTGYTAYTAFATNHAVGVTTITIPAATHAATTEDQLRGGYVLIFDGESTSVQFRGIIGNGAADANAAITVYLDGPLTDAIVSGTEAVEVYENPYGALITSSSTTLPFAGIPATNVAATATYFWVQNRGLCWTSPQSGVGGTNGQFGAYWRHDGSIDRADIALATTVPANSTSQYAGHTVAGDAAGNGPLFNLIS